MSLDLQEATRRDDAFNQLLSINEQLTNLPLFPSLCWAWCFDIINYFLVSHLTNRRHPEQR